jgi:hypothetical protein
MAVNKPPLIEQSKIDAVINAASPPASPPTKKKKECEKEDKEETKFTMIMDGNIATIIDEVRGRTKSSRRSWFLLAAIEKLKRDGDL